VLSGCGSNHGLVANPCVAQHDCPTEGGNDLSVPNELPDLAAADLKKPQD
jgi:hypothetical protein